MELVLHRKDHPPPKLSSPPPPLCSGFEKIDIEDAVADYTTRFASK